MEPPPEFLSEDFDSPPEDHTYRPALPNRGGEIIAWLCAASVALLNVLLFQLTGGSPPLAAALIVLFASVGALISFGNWMDLRTSIRVGGDGVQFSSPLRRVELVWNEILELHALRIGKGWRIVVRGKGRAFHFRTPTSIALGSGPGMMVGFPEGERLAGLICGRAGLKMLTREAHGWVARRRT